MAKRAPPEAEFVRNPVSNVAHKVLLGPAVVPKEEYTAVCGWKFGKADFELSPVLFENAGIRLCSRCLPAEHLLAKDALRGLHEA